MTLSTTMSGVAREMTEISPAVVSRAFSITKVGGPLSVGWRRTNAKKAAGIKAALANVYRPQIFK
jgi:hypothetical protein